MLGTVSIGVIFFSCIVATITHAQSTFEGMLIISIPEQKLDTGVNYAADATILNINSAFDDDWPPEIPNRKDFDLEAVVVNSIPDDMKSLNWDGWPPEIPNASKPQPDLEDPITTPSDIPHYTEFHVPEGSMNAYLSAIVEMKLDSPDDTSSILTAPAVKFEWPMGGREYIGIKMPPEIELESMKRMSVKAIEAIDSNSYWPPEMREVPVISPMDVFQILKKNPVYLATE